MNIRLQVDNSQLLLRLRNGQKRLAYAVVNAINATAKDIQQAEQGRVEDEFTVRQHEFIRRQAAIIKPFASVGQGRLYAEIAVGQKKRLLLSEFEQGGQRTAFKGKSPAVPLIGGARPSKGEPVDPQFYFSRMALRRSGKGGRRRRSREGKRQIFQGALGTYAIPQVGVFQRIPGQKRGRPLWIFTAKPPHLTRRLRFIETAREVADRSFPRRMQREIDHTLAFQAGRVGVRLG